MRLQRPMMVFAVAGRRGDLQSWLMPWGKGLETFSRSPLLKMPKRIISSPRACEGGGKPPKDGQRQGVFHGYGYVVKGARRESDAGPLIGRTLGSQHSPIRLTSLLPSTRHRRSSPLSWIRQRRFRQYLRLRPYQPPLNRHQLISRCFRPNYLHILF